MIDKIITALEPFAFVVIILAGTSLAGYVDFSNDKVVGIAVIFCGILLTLKHVITRVTAK